MSDPDVNLVKQYLTDLQTDICTRLAAEDGLCPGDVDIVLDD